MNLNHLSYGLNHRFRTLGTLCPAPYLPKLKTVPTGCLVLTLGRWQIHSTFLDVHSTPPTTKSSHLSRLISRSIFMDLVNKAHLPLLLLARRTSPTKSTSFPSQVLLRWWTKAKAPKRPLQAALQPRKDDDHEFSPRVERITDPNRACLPT